MPHPLAITWNLTEMHGWGLLGVHTALYLLDVGRPPLLLEKPLFNTMRPTNRERLAALTPGYESVLKAQEQHPGKRFQLAEHTVMHGLSNGFLPGPVSDRFRGRRNVGVIAYEDTRLTPEVVTRASSWDSMVVHSAFNRRLLEEKGVPNVRVALQGIDPTEIHPGTGSRRFGDRFVVFSGGKLEFRKGQDIVLAAFRVFQQRHPEALLVTAWHNPWPATAMSMADSPLGTGAPRVGADQRLDITGWATANGVPGDAFLDLGFLGRDQIASVLWDCHAAVFPNRCEGATNLVAMETMACAVPTVLSANTGHLDIVGDDRTYALNDQKPVADRDGSRIDWGESSVDELVERLEEIHADRAEAARRAANAARFMATERTWRRFAEDFVAAVDQA
ncbi:glycosyltransferase [Azospirillum sp. TSO22-1]|uniref:glycosyltransferase n=1 Tax=Azospirillum sp. TSO22-1 TaxID=716789 RepID=UPI000D61F835|nr:glycosyltransferase [Azospirillum sp. TSO22-1]PWC55346.1 glycosyltransferase [Azospirillum sp. TSO22-1]